MKTKNKIVIRHKETVQVFTLGRTANKKIAAKNEQIVQTYTYSRKQYEYVLNTKKPDFKTFFKLANTNCLDCVFSTVNNDKGGCYTHKFMQYTGFLSQLRSIAKVYGNFESIPIYDDKIATNLMLITLNKFVRFGTYGEPSLIPIDIVKDITISAKNWTGYSHQWHKIDEEYNNYFQASTHNIAQSLQATRKGYLCFQVVTSKPQFTDLVNCPASKESNFKSNCSKCGLCSGNFGKGQKSIYIFKH